ncbi:phosphoribosyl-AMP cyclohydrolase [Methanobrevibacter filiformis]|uniref:Phosphoribosyl-AMP cyclohydrolase n=1 Tax=Methanobrevibacter filiformis TaxID=55758 RepID=A0A166CGG5_9EURY|nr:phosphoribosyl-AMP cyclohydrolase [Methanobrevibacter filiformis]KZX14097.1 phosphoribosyl-AMP cyclohydrolase [Methanobrevibacter filiformis]
MEINFKHEKNGQNLVIAIAQDYKTLEVLMVAFMNKESLEKTLETKIAHYWSTSRNKLWCKGESSSHTQELKEIFVDCDMDAILLKVKQNGAACHEGYYSCFFRELNKDNLSKKSYKIDELDENDLKIIAEKVFNPKDIY